MKKITLINNLYNKDCCNVCKKKIKLPDKLTCYLNYLKKFFRKFFPNYFLALIGDNENILTDLLVNGYKTSDSSIFIHLEDSSMIKNFTGSLDNSLNKNIDHNIKIVNESVFLYNSLPVVVKKMINYVNNFVPYKNNDTPKGSYTIKLSSGKFINIKDGIPNNLGIHRLGLIKRSYINILNNFGFGADGDKKFLWKYGNLIIPVYNSYTAPSLKLKLILFAKYIKGSILSGRNANQDFINLLNTNQSVYPAVPLILTQDFSELSSVIVFIMLYLLNSVNAYAITSETTKTGFFSALPPGSITTNYSIDAITDIYGNIDLENDFSIYFDSSGNNSFDVVLLDTSGVSIGDLSGNFNLVDNSGNTIFISNLKDYVNSTTYDLSNNVFTYNLVNGIKDLSGVDVNSLNGYKIYDPSNNIFTNPTYNFMDTSISGDTTTYDFKNAFDSSGNSLLSFFDLYTLSLDTDDDYHIDYTIVENDYSQIESELNSLINTFINFENDVGRTFNNALSNNYLVILNFAKYLSSSISTDGTSNTEITNFITSQIYYDALKDADDIVDASYNILIRSDFVNSGQIKSYTLNNTLELYAFYLTHSSILSYPITEDLSNIFIDSSGISLGINNSTDYLSLLINGSDTTSLTNDIVSQLSVVSNIVSLASGIATAVVFLIIGIAIAVATAGAGTPTIGVGFAAFFGLSVEVLTSGFAIGATTLETFTAVMSIIGAVNSTRKLITDIVSLANQVDTLNSLSN